MKQKWKQLEKYDSFFEYLIGHEGDPMVAEIEEWLSDTFGARDSPSGRLNDWTLVFAQRYEGQQPFDKYKNIGQSDFYDYNSPRLFLVAGVSGISVAERDANAVLFKLRWC